MKQRIILGLASSAVLAAIVVATALATPSSGLVGTPLARGAAGAFDLHDKSQKLKLQAKEPLDVALVRATLSAGGFTGWHGHSAPSLVVVSAGSLTAYEPDGDTCSVKTYAQGSAFVHGEDAHNFVAGSGGAEFYIVYLLPQGASPAPIDVTPAPAACS
jgi:quercetin dioxygenase-like cupin family protein